jgi:hypothetical protein
MKIKKGANNYFANNKCTTVYNGIHQEDNSTNLESILEEELPDNV